MKDSLEAVLNDATGHDQHYERLRSLVNVAKLLENTSHPVRPG